MAYSERVHVTLAKKGTIFLNQKAHKMMGCPFAVYLYYNRQKDMIIIEPTSAVTANDAFQLRENPHGGQQIYANPFCKHFGIRVDAHQKFIDPTTDSAGRMYLKLSETITVSLGPRKKRQSRER